MGWKAELTSHDALRKVCGRKASEGPWLDVARRSYPEGRYCVVFDQEGRHQVAHRLVIRQHRHRATAVWAAALLPESSWAADDVSR